MNDPVERVARRAFLAGAVTGGAGLLLVAPAALAKKPPAQEQDEVSPAEDLMREHGVLERILLVYEEVSRRAGAGQEIPANVVPDTSGLVRRFVEDYHEKLEEDFLFPRFEKAGKLVELVATLRAQHRRGRSLTEQVQRLGALKGGGDRRQLAELLRAFIRMYRPHAAREDTVLFPALRGLVGDKAYLELGAQFEDKEHALFGAHGFEDIVAQVAKLEQAVGIDDLAAFTPKG